VARIVAQNLFSIAHNSASIEIFTSGASEVNNLAAALSSRVEVRMLTKRCNRYRECFLVNHASDPEGDPIFVTTSTSSSVALLRMLPEMVMSASEIKGFWSASVSRRSLTA
jgi:hypothetical protein